MGTGVLAKLRLGLGEADKRAPLAYRRAPHQEVQRDSGLARPGVSLNQVASARGPPAPEDGVEAGDPASEARLRFWYGVAHQTPVGR